jgi:hypothetical protein
MKTTTLVKLMGCPQSSGPKLGLACRPADARRPAVAEPLDVLADDAERRRKPACHECGRCGAGSCWFQSKHPQGEERCATALRSVSPQGLDVMVSGEAKMVTDPTIVARSRRCGRRADGKHSTTRAPASRAVRAPTLGPPPWFVYEVKPRTATAVGTAEETPGSTRWRF